MSSFSLSPSGAASSSRRVWSRLARLAQGPCHAGVSPAVSVLLPRIAGHLLARAAISHGSSQRLSRRAIGGKSGSEGRARDVAHGLDHAPARCRRRSTIDGGVVL